jgi:hypothetical protein
MEIKRLNLAGIFSSLCFSLLFSWRTLFVASPQFQQGASRVLQGVSRVLLGVSRVLLGVSRVLLGVSRVLLGVSKVLLVASTGGIQGSSTPSTAYQQTCFI